MLQLYVDPDETDGRIEFDRLDVDFTERDRRVLELLLPQLRQRLHAARRRSASGPRAHLLTAREREVLTHVADGRTNGEIAAVLHLSSGTVRKHLENAFEKLGVRTRTAAVAAAFGRSAPLPDGAEGYRHRPPDEEQRHTAARTDGVQRSEV